MSYLIYVDKKKSWIMFIFNNNHLISLKQFVFKLKLNKTFHILLLQDVSQYICMCVCICIVSECVVFN